MTSEKSGHEWRALGASVRGASHYRTGLPNQDAIQRQPEFGTGCPAMLAVADGHGSAGSFRSHTGAEMATTIAIEMMQELIEKHREDPSSAQQKAERALPREIVRRWWEAVADDLSDKPFSSYEMMRLERDESAKLRRNIALNPVTAYGATILGALVTDAFLLFAQLGDGDILTVSDDGRVDRPLPEDERLIGNVTTSLCLPEAVSDFRVAFTELTDSPPALVLVSSDGYANSFRDDDAFRQVGSDILDMLREKNLTSINYDMERWLREASESGSGDDTTLGILCRVDAVE